MSMMHTHTTMAMLLNLLVSSLFLALPNLIILVEARKFTASNAGVFKVDLINRDSPLSPYYNSSMTPQERLRRSPLGSISRGHNIQLSSIYYNTSDIGSYDLKPDGGGYLLNISVGTPKVDFLALADTGSDLIWVQCLPCEACLSSRSPPFDPTKSSTYQAIPCNDPACDKPDLNTGCSLENPSESSCHYQANYGKGSSGGILAKDTLSLPSSASDATSLSLPSSIFGCGTNQADFDEDGIIGLGTGPSSLISQLGLDINHKFSYCLPPLLNSSVNGKLALGGGVTGSGVVSTPFLLENDTPFYHLILDGISVGDAEIPVPSGFDIIIDSGTTYTMLPESVYGGVRTALDTAIGLSTTPSPVQTLDLCYDVGGGQFSPPDVVFHFKGADVVLRAYNTFREFNDGVHCLAMVATTSVAIFGNIAQVNFQVGYDIQAQTVSFAPADCTNY